MKYTPSEGVIAEGERQAIDWHTTQTVHRLFMAFIRILINLKHLFLSEVIDKRMYVYLTVTINCEYLM